MISHAIASWDHLRYYNNTKTDFKQVFCLKSVRKFANFVFSEYIVPGFQFNLSFDNEFVRNTSHACFQQYYSVLTLQHLSAMPFFSLLVPRHLQLSLNCPLLYQRDSYNLPVNITDITAIRQTAQMVVSARR